ncbi:MAG: hypothetical protein PHU75_03875 [Candidatus Nanopelagicales bacterium]|nr:hypothetical protein [Candidatus Nanopelagicales bacterium]
MVAPATIVYNPEAVFGLRMVTSAGAVLAAFSPGKATNGPDACVSVKELTPEIVRIERQTVSWENSPLVIGFRQGWEVTFEGRWGEVPYNTTLVLATWGTTTGISLSSLLSYLTSDATFVLQAKGMAGLSWTPVTLESISGYQKPAGRNTASRVVIQILRRALTTNMNVPASGSW